MNGKRVENSQGQFLSSKKMQYGQHLQKSPKTGMNLLRGAQNIYTILTSYLDSDWLEG